MEPTVGVVGMVKGNGAEDENRSEQDGPGGKGCGGRAIKMIS